MNNKNYVPLQINGLYYYFKEKVELLKIIDKLNLAKVIFINDSQIKFVDLKALTIEPSYEKTISIRELGGY